MFTTTGLSLPSTFANEHRPLRLTSDSTRPQPTGQCHSILLHPSTPNQRCSCQSFHHNRSTPGNVCDCGHQACFHGHEPSSSNIEKQTAGEPVSAATHNALLERMNRLENAFQNERRLRDNAIKRERQALEREIRILREALAPFYRSEQEMRRILVEVEDKVDANYDQLTRLNSSVERLDDANMTLQLRIEHVEGSRTKRRKVSRPSKRDEVVQMTNGAISPHDKRGTSSTKDDKSLRTPSSRARSPTEAHQIQSEHEEPRSSGILNLAELPRTTPFASTRQMSPVIEEPRSSGFLALDLAERLQDRQLLDHSKVGETLVLAQQPLEQSTINPRDGARTNSEGDAHRRVPSGSFDKPTTIVEIIPISSANVSPRKRKHEIDQHNPLDVLADASMASPLAH